MTSVYTPDAIGTPLSPSATKVMLLGSGELGKEVAIALQRLGVEVHAVDRYDGAPAHHVAQYHYVLDMTDPDAVKNLVDEVRPHYIVPEIEAIATDALLDLESEYTVIPTATATRVTMNREEIRRVAGEELGLPTSGYAFASTREEFDDAVRAMGFPCVVKPVMSSSGKGQSVLRGPGDCDEAWDHAMSGARVNQARVIVEQFVDFDYEITLLTVRSLDPSTGKVATWFCEPVGHRQHSGDYVESWQPAPMSAAAAENAQSIAARVTNALGGRGVFGVELFVKGDDVYFSEVSPRPHDTGMVTMGTQRLSEFDLHARAILGLPVDVTLVSPGASAVVYGGVEAAGVAFSGVREALAVPETDVRVFGKPEAFPHRRMGVVFATAEDIETARSRATTAASLIHPVVPGGEWRRGQPVVGQSPE